MTLIRPTFRTRRFQAALTGLVVAALVPIAAPTTAQAEGAVAGRGFVVPLGTLTPSLQDLQKGLGLAELERKANAFDSGAVPRETLGISASAGRRSKIPAVTPTDTYEQRANSSAISYPNPPRNISDAECEKALGKDGWFYLKSRFALCTGIHVIQIWQDDRGKTIGTSEYNAIMLGKVYKDTSRDIEFDYRLFGFKKSGVTQTGGFLIGPGAQILPDPSRVRVNQSGKFPGMQSWDQLAQQSPITFSHVINAAPDQGSSGSDDLVQGSYKATMGQLWPNGKPWVAELAPIAPRWDSAKYLKNSTGGGDPAKRGAAAFNYVATLNYSAKVGAPEKAVADHIKEVFTNPASTVPRNPAKKVPGQTEKDYLHRIVRDTKRHDRNRYLAVADCKRYFGDGYSQGGKFECDEYPFASTYEGAAEHEWDPDAKKENHSVLPIDAKQNGDAGLLLQGFYAKNRMLDGLEDGFIVKIT
ncbi:NucA/NucB deoxyribonuclease domain-containing protein [Streptomyces hygroscopicus]|uniref:NucA/NucB deoxyribonuclease domain-containing protein n=1 Tax=Streptomyces hygroscopicus TaxID=1912 RepID=UPI00207BC2D1|nr:hypothetical protein [Streptomyces hygroscopicus]